MDQQKPLIKRFWWLFLIVGLIIAIAGYNGWQSWKFTRSTDAKFITASPIDLSQFKAISKLRSCTGHDYSGITIDGETETNRSMKHYAIPLPKYEGTKDQVKLYAPFNGKVAKIDEPKPGSMGRGISFTTENGWYFEFGHIEIVQNFRTGDKVRSGQLVGYFEAQNGYALDLQMFHSGRYIDMFKGIDSYINHLTPELEAEYASHDITRDNAIVTKEARDRNPCKEFDQNPEQEFVSIVN